MDPTVSFGITLALVGMAIVVVVQLLIAGAIALVRTVDERWQQHERHAAEAALSAPPTIDHTTLILIAAAATAVLQRRKFRILQVRRLGSSLSAAGAWQQSGRTAIHQSHKVRD